MGLFSRWRRSRELPAAWRQILDANIPLCRSLPLPLREAFERHVQAFLDEKRFEGCGGLEVTDEMRVTIAGHACLLLLGDPGGAYPELGSVVVYPESFATPLRDTDPLGIVTETVEERLGESWQEGTVVLAWDAIRELVLGCSGDCNVVVHEFAHQIDNRHGISGGRGWAELLDGTQRRQRTARRRGRPELLDPYAFTSPEEFFAVASETFFMRPVRLKANHPELYAELQAVYRIDPAGWMANSR